MQLPGSPLPPLSPPRDLPSPSRSWSWWTLTAALVTLSRPRVWPVALAAFLLRGGIVALAFPLLVLPTPSGIADVLYAPVRDLYLGQPSVELVVAVGLLAMAAIGLFLGAHLVAAWLEADIVRQAADDEEAGLARVRPRPARRVARSALVARLLAHAPLVVALGWGLTALLDATYAELTLPSDPRQALLIRVLLAMPGPLLAVLVAWLVGEVAGGLAVRRVVLDGEGVGGALRRAWRDVLARPRSTLATTVLTDGALALGLFPAVVASALAAERLRTTLGLGLDGSELALSLVLFVGLWFATLVLAGALTTFRSVAWTFEHLRRAGPRTAVEREDAGRGLDDRPDWTAIDARSTL